MPAITKSARVCETCGTPIETTSSGDLGCMVCLFDTALNCDAEESEVAFAPPLDQVGAYTIERRVDGSAWELGHGAMGVTYRAIDKVLDRAVALKIINTDLGSRSAEVRERFMREARAAAALRHPNVATIYQFGIREETGQFFYAMELVEGETLEERVRRLGPLDVPITIDIALQVTAALAAAEERGLVHRDLKPGNLMLVNAAKGEESKVRRDQAHPERSRTGERREQTGSRNSRIPTVKVIDFGVAKAVAEKTNAMALTHGGFVGTPAFASPEQFTNAPVDVRSDIYSLGATLWFLLTGQMPFSGRTIEEIREARRSKPLPVEQLKAAHVPRRLLALLMSMLAIEPAARPAGARELSTKLQRIRASITDRRKIATRFAVAAAVILVLGVSAFFVFHSLRTHPAAAGSASNPATPEKSIAILPFENLSDDKEHAFLADGVQDDILTKLAKVADLKVISRTSVMQFRGKQDLRQIGRLLGVSHVLEGTVRRSAEKVHVNAQLVDTRTDTHVWAEEYDRDLTDVFAIEAELAQSIANRLRAKVSVREKLAMQEWPTKDLVAYDLYIRAKTLVVIAVAANTPAAESLSETIRLLNQAIERDPAFTLAYYQLAHAHDLAYFWGVDHTPARLAMADAAIQSLARLRPNSGEAHLAVAEHLYWGHLDYDHAREELKLAQKSLPNEPLLFVLGGYIDRRQGRWGESNKNLERAIELDPQNPAVLEQIAVSYLCLRRYADAEGALDRAITIAPKDSWMRTFRAAIELDWHADPRPLISTIRVIIAEDSREAENVADRWLQVSLYERDFDGARRALTALPIAGCYEEIIPFPRAWCEGIVAQLRGDKAAARAAFSRVRTEAAKRVAEQPDYAEALCVLGMADAALGNKEAAIREGRRAVELMPVSKNAIEGPLLVQNLALIYAQTGEKDLAFEQLAIAAHIPGYLSYGELRLRPRWDPLRGDPRFDKIVASLAPK